MKLLTDVADEVAMEAVNQKFVSNTKHLPLLVHTESVDAQAEVGEGAHSSRSAPVGLEDDPLSLPQKVKVTCQSIISNFIYHLAVYYGGLEHTAMYCQQVCKLLIALTA